MVGRVMFAFSVFSFLFPVFMGNRLASGKVAYISLCVLDTSLARLPVTHLKGPMNTVGPGGRGPGNRRPSQEYKRLSINNERTGQLPSTTPLVSLLFNYFKCVHILN